MTDYRGRHARSNSVEPADQAANQANSPVGRRSNPQAGRQASPTHTPRAERSHFRSAHDSAIQDPRHSKRKTVVIVVPILIVLVLLVAAATFTYNQFFAEPDVEPGLTVSTLIPEGSSTADIAKILKKSNVIKDESGFIKQVQSQQADASLKPGNYKLYTLMNTDELIELLIAGPVPTGTKLTIAEGLTIEQTAAAVAQACGIDAQEFINLAYSADQYAGRYPFLNEVYNNSMEGFLYPKTYSVPLGAGADTVIRMLLDQYALETSNLDLSYATEHNLTLFDVVIIASLIEKETLATSERELVAAVIYNRLHEGMRLQIDATVVYALGPTYDGHPLYNYDLEIDSPYNTYIVDQLPAGPICSPRIESIQAAAHPASTDYLYYVLTSLDGFHSFSNNFEQFEADKLVYEELFGI
jgi:UPF0755 protein